MDLPTDQVDSINIQADLGEVPSWGDDVLVVAPISGRFRAFEVPARIEAGTVIGRVDQIRSSCDVVSPFTGETRRLLVRDGHPVSSGQPLVWLVKVA